MLAAAVVLAFSCMTGLLKTSRCCSRSKPFAITPPGRDRWPAVMTYPMAKSPSTAPAIGSAVAGDTSGVQYPCAIDHSPARKIQPGGKYHGSK